MLTFVLLWYFSSISLTYTSKLLPWIIKSVWGFFNVWLVFCHRNSLFLQIHTLSDRHTADSKRYYIVYWKRFFFDSIVCQAQRHREREKLRERDIKRELWKVVLFAQRGCDGGMLQRIHHEQNRYVTTKAMNYTHAKKKKNQIMPNG